MLTRSLLITLTLCGSAFLQGCGGDSHGAYNPRDEEAPTAVTNLTGNAGDTAVSLGWSAPETGTTPLHYDIEIAPAAASATIAYSGTQALIRGLDNGTTYAFSVKARNQAGESDATTLLLQPTAIDADNFLPVPQDSADLHSPSGMLDPAPLNTGSTLWLAYASAHDHLLAGRLVQDRSTSLAYSNDSGATFTYLKAIGTATAATITPRTVNPCGNITCNGRWSYAAPFLVDDSSDPDSARRFKLFAHKYFLVAVASPANFPALGAIVMWTAPSPESSWSPEQVVLSWASTPQPLATTNNISAIHSELSECLDLREGSATIQADNLDFAFACSDGTTQKIVLLRSTDHAATFEYIATPLTAADAAAYGALYFSAPALLPTATNAPVLIATPVIQRAINGFGGSLAAYSGCIVFPFADAESGSLFRDNDAPLSILEIPYIANHVNGACAWDRGIGASGILMSDEDPSAGVPFSLLNTAKRL